MKELSLGDLLWDDQLGQLGMIVEKTLLSTEGKPSRTFYDYKIEWYRNGSAWQTFCSNEFLLDDWRRDFLFYCRS